MADRHPYLQDQDHNDDCNHEEIDNEVLFGIEISKRGVESPSHTRQSALHTDRAAGMAAASFSAVAVPIKSGLSAVTILRRLLACARPLHFLPQSQSPRRGLCQVAHAAKPVVVDSTLKGIGDRNIAEAVNNILEMAGRATTRREVLHTDFLTPPVVKESILALEKLANVKAVAQGGYPQAERCRLSVGHPDDMPTDPDVVAALSITGNFTFDACSHGDFLGAILSTGIVREKVGDILLQGEKGSQVVVVPELTDFLMSTLDKVQGPFVALQFPCNVLKTQTCLVDCIIYTYVMGSQCTVIPSLPTLFDDIKRLRLPGDCKVM
ncbi:hypothetical protein GW17_00051154 [Ensete ventricosum]|nr:hypothetical protein GW17_00051154 [Ensete ventricosum]